MDRILSVVLVLTLLLVCSGIVLLYYDGNMIINEKFVPLYNETPTKIVLINSNLTYHTSELTERDIFGDTIINKGDPYVEINGTIKNEYDKDYFFWLYGNIENKSGETVGHTLAGHLAGSFNAPYIHLNKSSTTSFSMKIAYNKTDVESYLIYLPAPPNEEWQP